MNNKNMIGNGSKATLPGGQKLSDKIQENKTKQGLNNNVNGKANNGNNNLNEKENSNNAKSSKGKEENGENKKSKLDNATQQAGTEAARVALKTFAASNPYTSWIPKGIRDKIVDKIVDSKLGQSAIEKQGKKLKLQMVLVLVAVIGSILYGILMIAVIYTVLMAPIAWLKDATKGIGEFFASLGHWFIGEGFCPSEEKCNNKASTEYYELLNEAIKKYNDKSNGCLINEDLITSTIFYGQIMTEKKEETETGNYFNFVDVSEGFGNTSAASRVKKLVSVYFSGSDDESEEEGLTDYPYCQVNVRSYRQYLINTYIDDNYPSMINKNRTKEDIADEILKMGNISLITRSFSSSIYCPSIAVEQEDGNIESMTLEDYVARVVTNENNWHEGGNIENMKAQAVAARTYALNATDNCKNSISNSTNAQTVAATPDSLAIRAAEETNSEVLLKDGKVFSTQYDALAIDHSDDSNYYLKQANLAIPKSWLDSKVSQSQYEFYASHNHGNGMSQWGSRYLQSIGKDYKEILKTFYLDAELGKMGGLISGGNYTSNTMPAVNKTELAERRDYYINLGIDYIYTGKSGLISQCPWYAKSRALEILYYSDMEDELKTKAMNSIQNTNGNGVDFAGNTDPTIFTHSNDCTDIRPGSIASWSTTRHQYGHVAIVEKINDDGTVLISEGWNASGVHAGNNWDNVAISARNVNREYFCKHDTYTFKSFAYLLG